MRLVSLSLLAAFALAGCDEKSGAPRTASSVAAADVNAASPLDKPYRLKGEEKLDVDRLFAVLPLYLRPTYDKASFDRRLGATVVTNLRFGDIAKADGFTVARAEFYDVDLEKIEELEQAAEAAPDAPLQLIVRKLRLYEVAGADGDDAGSTIGAIEIDTLRVREGGLPKQSPASGLAGFFNALDVAGVYFKDVKIIDDDASASESGAAFDLSAPDIRFVGLGGGKLDAFIARDLSLLVRQSPAALAAAGRGLGPAAGIFINGPLRNFIAPENQRTRFKTLEWRDISFAGLMSYGLTGARPPITARNLINLGTAKLTDAETFIGDKRLSIVPTTDISAMEFTWLAPSKIRAVTRGGLYDFTAYVPDSEEEAIDLLRARGLDKITGDSDLAFDWNADKGDAVFSTGFDSAGFADVDIDLALDGLQLKKIEDGRAAGAPRPAYDLARLKSLSIVIADEQLLDAFYALSALETGGTAKDVRAAAPTLMRLAKIEIERESPRLASYVEAIADFLEDGGTLEIRAAPETPIPLTAIAAATPAGPEAVVNAIDLTVTRTE